MTTAQESAEREAELWALREAVRDLVEGCGGLAPARRQFDSGTGYDEQAWRLLGREMGLAGLGVPENMGGAGGGLAELTVVAEELGRALLPVPFLSSTVLAGQILARCPEPPDLLGQLAGGDVWAAFAGVDADGCWHPDRLPARAENGAGSWRLSGRAEFVLDGTTAHQLVVAASTPDGCDLFLVAGDDSNVRRRALETLDPTRGQAEVSFDGVSATALTSAGSGAEVVSGALDVVLVVLAAEQVGGAAASLDMAVDYAKIRQQFSRPIGSFQAIKHKLADLLLQVEMGRSALDRAVLAEQDGNQLAEAAAVAQVWCSDAFVQVAAENVHVNGGTGFTWEHDAHLYFRRSRADEVLFGDASVHRERLARLLGW
jgi:alkylation response protein AidB-like acyl-CoA dehydrogenase